MADDVDEESAEIPDVGLAKKMRLVVLLARRCCHRLRCQKLIRDNQAVRLKFGATEHSSRIHSSRGPIEGSYIITVRWCASPSNYTPTPSIQESWERYSKSEQTRTTTVRTHSNSGTFSFGVEGFNRGYSPVAGAQREAEKRPQK